ncbi:CLUMA_CG008838, isoform A [Clunio marinus]|uniref:CLUMA_CG008838, isoform A n=1 Tax=Clunio marinus TaxID=568069 RepID=A0A1J1I4T9_9DIPT|nr:CLUMA_CG008838, isoform A [Clunio marinus]
MIENNTLISVFRYKQPQYRLGEYLVGIAFGYLIYTSNGKKLRLGKFITLSCWILSLGFIGIHTFTRIWWTSNSTINHILQATHVEAWTCSISWIVFACHVLKSGSIIRKFLSKLTDFNQKVFIVRTLSQRLLLFTSDVIISFSLGLIFYLLIEAPTSTLIGRTFKAKKH